ncbi:hypothetical protein [Prauserella endophytica]|uniref:Recombination endonuclease VII n=1 Tax=Prauserella endophytica TaxID=1592324 RepID=A0ABY2S0M8_9PSEU|nr:hypothetical protein [Prauserella endophytica]TKG66190.1 hypothetical protein FCN18_25455 [Prauserella endophytica]
MSNRPKLTPPPEFRRYAKRVRCTDCNSETGRPRRDEHGIWHVPLLHDPWCPVLNGQVSTLDIHTHALTRKETA